MGASEYRGARRESGAMLLMSRRNLNQGFAWRNNSWIIRHHGSGQGLLGQWMLAMMPNLVQWLSMNLWVVFRWSCQTLPGTNYMRISVSVFLKRSSSGSKECLGLEIETATLVHRTWLPKELNTTFKVIWFFFIISSTRRVLWIWQHFQTAANVQGMEWDTTLVHQMHLPRRSLNVDFGERGLGKQQSELGGPQLCKQCCREKKDKRTGSFLHPCKCWPSAK